MTETHKFSLNSLLFSPVKNGPYVHLTLKVNFSASKFHTSDDTWTNRNFGFRIQ